MKSFTIESLGAELRKRYEEGLLIGNAVASIHKFGLEYADEIDKLSPKKIIAESKISSKYLTELYKGTKLAKLGIKAKQVEYTIDDLVAILKKYYSEGLKNGDAIGEIFMFGIKYGTFIKANNFTPKLLAEKAQLKDALATEISKGIKLSGQVVFQ